ncbi:MAG: nucleotidyltransferase family protein [Bacteroidales bacterium]|nr:nucleotidyltransferase family protein [Bacteroidales bacterium]
MAEFEHIDPVRELTLRLLRAAIDPRSLSGVEGSGVEGSGAERSGVERSGVDGAAVMNYAALQGITAPVFDGYIALSDNPATAGDLPPMPDPIKEAWLADRYRHETLAIAQRSTAAKMAATFAQNGLRTYVLKGEVVSECYPVPSHRRTHDLDCFLLPKNLEEVGLDNGGAWEKGNRLMENEGIEVSRHFYKHSAIKFPLLKVENHQFFTPFRGDRNLRRLEILLQSLLKADPGEDKIDGTDLLRPPVMVSALFLLEHAHSHYLLDGLSIRHVLDWTLFWRRHEGEIDGAKFNEYVDGFGFRTFLDSLDAAGEFILGKREYSSLSQVQARFLDSVLDGMYDHVETPVLKSKLQTARNIIRSSWRYRTFSTMSMPKALWLKIFGFFFNPSPTLN